MTVAAPLLFDGYPAAHGSRRSHHGQARLRAPKPMAVLTPRRAPALVDGHGEVGLREQDLIPWGGHQAGVNAGSLREALRVRHKIKLPFRMVALSPYPAKRSLSGDIRGAALVFLRCIDFVAQRKFLSIGTRGRFE